VIRRSGPEGWLVETGTLAVSHRFDALLRADRPAGVTEIVPGPETVLVVARDFAGLTGLLETLLRTALAPAPVEESTAAVTIPVVYDGADLAGVAALTGLTTAEVIRRHTARELTVGWLGFAPGFAYLVGLDPALHVPRLDTPRTAVPAGSVAVAGPYAAVYPSASPGGWRLLGRTSLTVWDSAANPPSLLPPGTRVRFAEAT
jgi:KipI family sensor histidine kinase inhibitor